MVFITIKQAPHHTFFSWRRYCNKHKIQLGGYSTSGGLPTSAPRTDDLNVNVDGFYDEDASTHGTNTPASTITLATEAEEGISEHGDAAAQSSVILIGGTGGRLRYRNCRSKTQGISEESHSIEYFYQDKEPEAPKSLYRSKSGKGIAFTRADVDFLVRYISFRRSAFTLTALVDHSTNQFWRGTGTKAYLLLLKLRKIRMTSTWHGCGQTL